jgi:hypothetical protein
MATCGQLALHQSTLATSIRSPWVVLCYSWRLWCSRRARRLGTTFPTDSNREYASETVGFASSKSPGDNLVP